MNVTSLHVSGGGGSQSSVSIHGVSTVIEIFATVTFAVRFCRLPLEIFQMGAVCDKDRTSTLLAVVVVTAIGQSCAAPPPENTPDSVERNKRTAWSPPACFCACP